MESATFEKVNGPLSVHLDEVLKKMNVKRQAYHGKSLIGNHVHICCKVTQILPLEKEIVESQNSIKLLRVSFLVGRQYHLTMQYCGDKKQWSCVLPSFLKQEKLVLNLNKFSSYLLLAT